MSLTFRSDTLDNLIGFSVVFLRHVCLPCIWCACVLTHICEDEKKRSDELHSRLIVNENANRSGESTALIYDRGDSKGIDIVARRKPCGKRKRLPNNRRVIGSGTNARITTLKRARRQHKNNLSGNKKDTARLRSAEGTFRVHKIYGDGNCMFRAVSYILWGNEDEHRSLRTLVTHHIKYNWREYGPFVTAEWNITNPNVYHDFMISEGVFATELECTVATKLHGMNLSIYRKINERGDVKRVFYNRVNGSYETARLLFSGRSESGHYDVLFIDS